MKLMLAILWKHIQEEPVLISAIVGNLLAFATSFGFGLDEAQTAAIMGIVSTLTVLVFGRSKVRPLSKLEADLKGE